MRRSIVAVILLASVATNLTPAEAATIQVSLNFVAGRDITIPVEGPNYVEFKAQRSDWGTVTVGGGLVAYYVFSFEDRRHELNPGTLYPQNLVTLVIRTAAAPTELLVLRGSDRPLSEGGGTYGTVIVATGSLAFLRGASFTTASAGGGSRVLTLTY